MRGRDSDREVVGVRVFDAPRGAVFRAWTDPEALKAWWGPKGFTNTFDSFELRPGPDGRDYPNTIVFLEIIRMIFRSEAERKAVEVYAVPGNRETFDKLAAYLAEARKENRGGYA